MARSLVSLVAAAVAAITTLLPGAAAASQQGPGLGNLTYAANERFTPISIVKSPRGHGNCAMVHGYLMVIYSSDGGGTSTDGGIDFWDVSDPRHPALFKRYDDADTHRLREGHGYGFATIGGRDYLCAQADTGLQVWDVTDPGAMRFVSRIDLPGITISDYEGVWWVFWQAPYAYAAGVSQGLFVVDLSDPANPVLVQHLPTSQLAGLGPSQAFAVGDLLVLTRSRGGQYVTMDIGDPTTPKLLSTFQGSIGYSHIFAAGDIFTSGGDGGPVQMSVHSVSHQGQIAFVGQSSYPSFSNGGYGSYQDGFFHSGMSNEYAKFDAATFAVVGTGSSNISGRDEDFGQVLGNIAFVGDDHGVGSALIVHDTQPDSHGPDVAWIDPDDGASGVPLTTRVGVSMSDNVDFTSLSTATFTVRPLGGAPLAGTYSVQMGLCNFAPAQPLQPDTLYEVDINGIRDVVGNTGAAFHATFSTYRGAGSGTGGAAIGNVQAQSGRVYATDTLAVGKPLYVDRSYTYVDYPAPLDGQPYVLTANDDKFAQGASFLTFDLGSDSRVYVLFDARATALPAWLASWSSNQGVVHTTAGDYTIRWRDFPAGPVALGGNADPPMAGASSNYMVVVVPSGTGVVPPSCSAPSVTPAPVRSTVAFTAPAPGGTPPFTYEWDFGDGTRSGPSSSLATSHVYVTGGRFPVVLTVRNSAGSASCSAVQVVHEALTSRPPAASSPIVVNGSQVLTVNPDNDTVTAIDTGTLAVQWEAPAGDDPRTLAVAPSGEVWVADRGDSTISVLRSSDGALQRTLPLPRASQPFGLVFAPDGSAAFVALQATGVVLRLDPATGVEQARAELPGQVRGLAVSADASKLLVTRFVSPSPARTGVVWQLDPGTMTVADTFELRFDPGPDSENSGRGVPNYLTSLSISPDGSRVLVPSKKDDTARGLYRSGEPLTFESRTRTIVSQIDLDDGGFEDFAARLDLNDRDMAQSATWSPLGDLFLVATQGTNTVEVFDRSTRRQLASLLTGRAPQGLVFEPSGARLWVKDFMDRAVTVFDTGDLVAGRSNGAQRIADIVTVSSEALSPQVLSGKRIFYNAADRRMNRDGYISCASCHLDGDSDGQVWDFTQSGEGLRNTIAFAGRAGTGHGNVHWTANFDEIQDFENDIRLGFSGAGFMTDPDFAATMNPLGPPKAGLSADLDALAAYVTSLNTFPESPFRNQDGTMTEEALAGQRLFQTKGCIACHVPPKFTDELRHDVGTIVPGSGLGIGQPLPGVGFDTPTLRAVWSAPPFLHAGQAATLADVLKNPTHTNGALSEREVRLLVAYLRQIE